MPRKHSLTIRGHATSITLEPEFWDELKSIAATRGIALAALVAEIDATRGEQNLSSALRVFVLKALRENIVIPA
jgi:predicted DNA-binding ribbon-helix-helix protein